MAFRFPDHPCPTIPRRRNRGRKFLDLNELEEVGIPLLPNSAERTWRAPRRTYATPTSEALKPALVMRRRDGHVHVHVMYVARTVGAESVVAHNTIRVLPYSVIVYVAL